jgi:hypothetical protein
LTGTNNFGEIVMMWIKQCGLGLGLFLAAALIGMAGCQEDPGYSMPDNPMEWSPDLKPSAGGAGGGGGGSRRGKQADDAQADDAQADDVQADDVQAEEGQSEEGHRGQQQDDDGQEGEGVEETVTVPPPTSDGESTDDGT